MIAEFDSAAWIELFKTIAVIVSAVLSFLAMRKSGQNAIGIKKVSEKTDIAVEQVKVIEKATNSMKDALVLATKVAGEAVGNVQGRQDERDEYPRGRPAEPRPDPFPVSGETPVVIEGTIKTKGN